MKRDLQKRPTKETYKCDLLTLAYLNELPNVRHMPRDQDDSKETYKRDLQK